LPEELPRGADAPVRRSSSLWLHVGVFGGIALASPVLAAFLLALMLRRMGMMFRVDVIGSSPPVPRTARETFRPVLEENLRLHEEIELIGPEDDLEAPLTEGNV
jgi:hypothetical protein